MTKWVTTAKGWLRVNRRPALFILGSLLLFLVVLRVGGETEKDTFGRDLILVFGGAIVGTTCTFIVQFVQRTETYKQGAYTERAKAVQEILAKGRDVKDACIAIWDNRECGGETIMTLDLGAERSDLLRLAFYHTVWIGPSGVKAVRNFSRAVEDPKQWLHLGSRGRAEEFINDHFERLVGSLMGGLGYSPQ